MTFDSSPAPSLAPGMSGHGAVGPERQELRAFQQPHVTFDAERHLYTYQGAPVVNVTSLLRTYRISRDWSDIPPSVLDEKRDIGRAAHIATHYLDEDDLQPGTVAPAVEPYVEAWRAFRADLGFVPFLLETALVHPLLRYAGTLDRFGLVRHLQSAPSVVDIKTGDPDDAGAGPQTAAYEQLVRVVLTPEFLSLLTGISLAWWRDAWNEPWTRYSVQLLDTGRYRLCTYTSHRDLVRFNWALSLEASCHPSWKERVS